MTIPFGFINFGQPCVQSRTGIINHIKKKTGAALMQSKSGRCWFCLVCVLVFGLHFVSDFVFFSVLSLQVGIDIFLLSGTLVLQDKPICSTVKMMFPSNTLHSLEEILPSIFFFKTFVVLVAGSWQNH